MRPLNEVVGKCLGEEYMAVIKPEYDELRKQHEALKKKTDGIKQEAESEVITRHMMGLLRGEGLGENPDLEVQKAYWEKVEAQYKNDVVKLEQAIRNFNRKYAALQKQTGKGEVQIETAAFLLIKECFNGDVVPFSMMEKFIDKVKQQLIA